MPTPGHGERLERQKEECRRKKLTCGIERRTSRCVSAASTCRITAIGAWVAEYLNAKWGGVETKHLV